MIKAADGISQDAVDRAEVAVCLALGLETLEIQTHRENGKTRGRVIPLPLPASRLLSVTLWDDHDATDYAELLTPYGVQLATVRQGLDVDLSAPIPAEVVFRTGWDPDRVPLAIRQAVLLTAKAESAAADLGAIPEGVSSIRLPEISVQFAGTSGHRNGGIPAQVGVLLKPWQRIKW